MDRTLEGHVGVVTGAAQGLGRAMTDALTLAGARVALFDVAVEPLAQAHAELQGAGAEVIAREVDVRDPDAVRAALDDVVGWGGRLSFLVNNAGIRFVSPFAEYPLEAWKRTLDVNLTGAFVCSQAATPHFRRAGTGCIVNVASGAAELALRDRVAYCVSKAGIVMLTKAIAYELGGEGIRANAVAPGVIETPLTSRYFEDERFASVIRANAPLGRWGQPDEVADAVVFLCSDKSRYVLGHTLYVDGGWIAGKGY